MTRTANEFLTPQAIKVEAVSGTSAKVILVPNRGLFLLTLDPALGRLTRVGLELSAAEGTVAVRVCRDPYAPQIADR